MKCAFGFSFYQELWWGVFSPLLLILLLIPFSFLSTRLALRRKISTLFFWEGCAVLVVFLVYGTLTKQLLEVFNCEGPFHQGRSLVLADLRVPCYDRHHEVAMAGSGVLLMMWALTMPALVAFLARPSRAALQVFRACS